ncbi:MAG: hypothetical protein QM757_09595 [Paludibaculum sp.]
MSPSSVTWITCVVAPGVSVNSRRTVSPTFTFTFGRSDVWKFTCDALTS